MLADTAEYSRKTMGILNGIRATKRMFRVLVLNMIQYWICLSCHSIRDDESAYLFQYPLATIFYIDIQGCISLGRQASTFVYANTSTGCVFQDAATITAISYVTGLPMICLRVTITVHR